MNKVPLVSFITICYNGFKDTCELIDSLQSKITSVTFEIIVVDNASFKNEAVLLQKKYPDIIAVRSIDNLGFSGGNNLGIKKASGKYIFLINNDTYIVDDNIMCLVERLERDPQIAGVSPKIKFAASPQNIQFAGYTPLSKVTLRNDLIGFNKPDSDRFNEPLMTPYLHGAAMMLKRSVVNKVGLMPDIYFLYYEELDWSSQMTRAGYTLWYEPEWTVFHKESQSTGQLSKLRTFFLTRNRLLYAWRNLNGSDKWLSIIYQTTIPVIKNTLLYIIKGRFDLVAATFAAINAFIILPNKTA